MNRGSKPPARRAVSRRPGLSRAACSRVAGLLVLVLAACSPDGSPQAPARPQAGGVPPGGPSSAAASSPSFATPELPAGLVLQGVVVAADPRDSQALVALAGQVARRVAVGDAVAEGWVLQSVSGEQAVLRSVVNAADVVLPLQAGDAGPLKASATAQEAAAAAPRADDAASLPATGPEADPHLPAPRASSAPRRTERRSRLHGLSASS